jgi:hypothetical protein
MENNTQSATDQIVIDRLYAEAIAILDNSNDLNAEREKLKSFWDKVAKWKDDNSKDEIFFEQLQKMLVAMAGLDFSKRLQISSIQKSFQNLMAYSMNHLNEELEEKVFPLYLLSEIMKEIALTDTIIVSTDYDGNIKHIFTSVKGFPTQGYQGKPLSILFEDMKVIEDLQLLGPRNAVRAKLKFGYHGDVTVKIRSTMFKISEGLAYIINIPKSE